MIPLKRGSSYFYLIKDRTGLILGRMNLVDIEKTKGIGYIGYRVGESHTGKGIANKALNLLLENTERLGIRLILAKTTTNNIESQRVLEKCGFKYKETSEEEFNMNGQQYLLFIMNG